jgi:DNA-binding NarL/FixJ family response regulator
MNVLDLASGSVQAKPITRELEVLALICEGLTTKDVAARLGMTFKTAASHRSALHQKAGVLNSVQLFRWALKAGYVSL